MTFEEIYINYNNSKFKHFVFNYVKNMEIAEDIISNSLISAYEKFNKFNPELSEFKTWLYTIAKNECLNYLKKQKKISSLDKTYSSHYSNSEKDYLNYKDSIEDESDKHKINEFKLQKLFSEIFKKLGNDSISSKIIKYKYLDKLTAKEIVKKLNQPSINDNLQQSYVSEKVFNISYIKNNLKKSEKILKEHFKNYNLSEIL